MQTQEQSVVQVKLCYLGPSIGSRKRRKHKTRQTNKYLTEVMVQQQARGYTPLPVYKGELRPGGKERRQHLSIVLHMHNIELIVFFYRFLLI